MNALLGEIDHPKMAHEDSAKLVVAPARGVGKPSPPASVVGAVARFLCENGHPLAHLGFFYLLEGTTAKMAPRMWDVLQARKVESPFIRTHATEDLAHRVALARKIEDIINLDPTIAPEIEYAHDCFAVAYPMPVWAIALKRVEAGIAD